MKQRIRLTESQLHRVIKESVKQIIKEIADTKETQDNIQKAVTKSAIDNIKTRLKGKKISPRQEHNRLRNLNIEKFLDGKRNK